MVGILRSKACVGCRTRRKKCDEIRPECGLCLKRGIECKYKDDLNIVFVHPASNAPHNGRRKMVSSSDSSPQSSSTSTPFDLPQTCLATSYRMQTQGTFLDAYLPSSFKSLSIAPTGVNQGASTAWLYSAYEIATTDELLSDALSALSLVYLENGGGYKGSVPNSRVMYGRTMRSLSRRLNSQDEVFEDATLAAVMLLSQYESQNATRQGANGWISHAKGTTMLIEARGKRNIASPFAQQLFLGSRLNNLIAAIGKRKAISPLAFSSPDAFNGQSSSFARLFEILQMVPAILEQGDTIVDSLSTLPTDKLESRTLVMAYTCRDFESRLLSWQTQLEQELERHACNNGKTFWPETSTFFQALPIDSPSRIFSTFHCFPNLDIAQQVVLSWVGRMFMHIHMSKTERTVHGVNPNIKSLYSTDTERSESRAKSFKLALDILQSFEYFIQPAMGLTAMDFLGLPMNLVYGYLTAWNAREVLWFEALFPRLRAMSPGFGEFMEAMAKQGGGGEAFKLLVLQK